MRLLGRRYSVYVLLTLLLVSLAQAATDNTLYSFGAPGSGDGMQPVSIPVLDSNGNLYGTTMLGGGPNNAGVIFELSPSGNNQWVETILHEFTGGSDGGYPSAGLVFHNGNLYGTGGSGGANGTGVVFELSPQNSGWTYRVLYSFGAYPASGDGFDPNSPIVFDKQNNLYGTTNEGGVAGCFEGCGTVFKLSPNGNGGWNEKLIHKFIANGKDGQLPSGGLTFDTNGNLYGTTPNGGTANSGVLYQLSYSSTTKTWIESIVHNFIGGSNDGSFPTNVILISDLAGNLYGTTDGGGKNGHGTVFEMTKSNTGWANRILYSFNQIYTGDGSEPHGGVVLDNVGNLYGSTYYGGAYNYFGTVFKLSKSSTGTWKETVLYSFTGGADGGSPQAGVLLKSGRRKPPSGSPSKERTAIWDNTPRWQ